MYSYTACSPVHLPIDVNIYISLYMFKQAAQPKANELDKVN